jgi:glycosyltransferase involved in cell wall biosynthesis
MTLSVVVATYNRANFIQEALESVAKQTTPPLEIVVVDDASTDDTEARVRASSHHGSPVVYHRLPENRGAAVARNVGVELARGEVIVFLDSDDLLEPTHHARVREVLGTQPETSVFSCDALLVDAAGGIIRGGQSYWHVQCAMKGIALTSGARDLEQMFLRSTLFVGCAVRREVYQRVGGLRQELFPLEDYDLMLRVAEAGHTVYYEHAPLGRYRMHSDNSSGFRHAVFVQEQRLRCLLEALDRSPELRRLGTRAEERVGEVRRELALTHLKARHFRAGITSLLRSFWEDPEGVFEVRRIALRWLRRQTRREPPR